MVIPVSPMKRILSALALAVPLAGCAAWQSEPPCTGEYVPFGAIAAGRQWEPTERDLTPGERRRIHARLAAAGFDPGPVAAKPEQDRSYFTPRARKAIARWREFCQSPGWGDLMEDEVRVLLEDE